MKALVTGGSRGIGKAIGQELADAGHDILLVAKDVKTLKQTAQEIQAISNVDVRYFSCDLGSVEEITNLYRHCIESDFIPSVLVLCAGIFIEGSLIDSQAEDFNQTLNVDLISNYHFVKLFVNSLKTQPSPKIILIGSTAAYESYPIGPLYGVAKWALRGYAINLRNELMKDGVGVTFISPGGTLTDLWEGEELPENRLLEPRDIGKLVRVLLTLSNQAVVEELIVRPMLGDIHE
jgi:short-subunit dehydrogenase